MSNQSFPDQVLVLREYRKLAPWNLHDLVDLAGGLLENSGIRPTSAAASIRPNERTIRYYVTRGLVEPPTGRGAAATYTYRHLLQVLSIKLRQMEGTTLENIARDLSGQTGDTVERHVAASLGSNLPVPSQLSLRDPTAARGRSARALHAWHALGEEQEQDLSESSRTFAVTKWHRVPIVRGLELHVHEGHPLAQHIHRSREIGDAVRRTISRLLTNPE
jgi:DNA-binding transcriptional MerR regulator